MAEADAAEIEAGPPIKKRSAILAAILSVLCPGLGQLYNVQTRRGLWCFAAVAALLVVFSLMKLLPPLHWGLAAGLWVVAGFATLLNLGIAVDAFLGARRAESIVLRRYNRGVVYLGIIVAWLTVTGAWMTGIRDFGRVSMYSIPSASTAPALVPGDYVMASRNHYRDREPERGDLIVFKLPMDNETDYVKRVVGLPGDRIQLKGGILHIDGRPVQRESMGVRDLTGYGGRTEKVSEYLETLPSGRQYPILEVGDERHYDNTREYLVPADHYFFLGDNRDRSEDSRGRVGFVPRANLRDYPSFIFWSSDWRRIGTAVQARR